MEDIYRRLHHALDVLNLPAFVSLSEIRERYIELTKQNHSDINEKDSKMREINEAYDLLKKYANNFRFSFSEEEIERQFPESKYAKNYRI